MALDCASEHRLWHEPVHEGARLVVNIDHHHDNTRFGEVNLVDVYASCTAEIVFEISKRLGAKEAWG